MSFSYNPYEHIEIVTSIDGGGFLIHCHSCGADIPGEINGPFRAETSIGILFNCYARHLVDSHNRLPLDFLGWSKT